MATKKKATKKKAAKKKAVRKVAAPRPHWSEKLREAGACDDALNFARGFPTFAKAWKACDKEGWLYWVLERTDKRFKHDLSLTTENCPGCRFRSKNRNTPLRKLASKTPSLANLAVKEWSI